MWILVESAVAVWLIASTWWLERKGPARSLHALVGALIAYLAAVVVAVVVDLPLGWSAANLWTRLLVVSLVGTVVFGLVLWRWNHSGEERRERWLRVLSRLRLVRLIRAILVLIWIGAQILVLVLVVNGLATAWPAFATAVRQDALILPYLLGTPPRDRLAHDFAAQQRELRGFRAGLTRGVDRLLDATGSRRVMETMEALTWISGLQIGELDRLVATEPALRRLIDEPHLRAVIEDQRLMELVGESVEGSLTAVYALGGEPAIQALVESPTMREALLSVDPVGLQRRYGAHPGVSTVAWSMTSLATSLDLDAALADAAKWTKAPGGHLLLWADGDRYGLVRAVIKAGAGERLQIWTEAEVSCWVNGALVRLAGGDQGRETSLPDPVNEVVVLLDFGGMDAPRAATLRIIQAAATGD